MRSADRPADEAVRISPVPSQCGQGRVEASSTPVRSRWRLISISPNERDPADLDAGAVVLQRLLHRLLDLADMAVRFHVDEVDHDQPGHVAQAQLAGDLVRRLDVGRVSGLLDIVLAGRAARVDVDRDQGLGRVDHQIAARLQLDDRLVHRGELVLGAVALEQRHRIDIVLHPLDVARHQQLHELPGVAIAVLALDDHLVDVAIVDVADRALDEVAVLIDQRRRADLQRLLADLVPQPGEIVEVALDLGLGARQAGGADDQPIALGRLRSAMICFSRLRSAPLEILRLMPPPWLVLGISTQ